MFIKHKLNIVCLTGMVLVIALGGAPSNVTAGMGQKPKYVLDMSENDDVCKPLLNFYNKHLNEQDDENIGYIEDRFKIGVNSTKPTILIGASKAWDLENFSSIDIYNDGDPRNITLMDRGINSDFMTFGTELIVMKKDYLYSDTARPTSASVDAWIVFPNGNISKGSNSYPLRKYHDYKRQKEIWDRMDLADRAKNSALAPPVLGYEAVGQRIIEFKNQIYILARERSDGVLLKGVGLRIVLYRLLPSGDTDDVCYLSLK